MLSIVAPPGPATRPPQPTILVAEDEALTALYLVDVLQSAGFRVLGPFALADHATYAAERERPDLCLFDVRLANGTDGLAAAHYVRNALGIPTVLVSVSIPEGSPQAQAFDGCCPKPFTESRLLQVVEAVMVAQDAAAADPAPAKARA